MQSTRGKTSLIHDKAAVALFVSLAIVFISIGLEETSNYINTGSFESISDAISGTIHQKQINRTSINGGTSP